MLLNTVKSVHLTSQWCFSASEGMALHCKFLRKLEFSSNDYFKLRENKKKASFSGAHKTRLLVHNTIILPNTIPLDDITTMPRPPADIGKSLG